jgi:hypothetical protein
LAFCFALYLAILFGVVIPTHHHKDGVEHSDCAVCVISHQPVVTQIIVSVFLAVVILFIKLICFPEIIPARIPRAFCSRAPPARVPAF